MATILAIEDHPDSLYMIQTLLSGSGHEVLTAQNGAEGLSLAIESRPALIVSDILMPHMDGYQLCAAVRSNPRLKDTRFAFYTATYTDLRDEELAYDLGADLFLRKPLEAELLIERLTPLLDDGGRPRAQQQAASSPQPKTLKLYNERLVQKLEKKMLDLKNEIQRREEAEATQRSLERQLAHAQKMELLGQLAGGVAHDFNNLLQVISGNIELAQGTLEKGGDCNEFLADAHAAARRSAELVRQLLQFSRKHALKTENINANELLESISKMLRRLITAPIALEVVPSAVPCWLHGEPAQIEQILLNLCVNARDAILDGGTVTVSVTVGLAPPPEICVPNAPPAFVRLRVQDTGSGISDEARERIFEPFFTTKPVGLGTGLGLAMVAAIARRHGGDVCFTSAQNEGTTFDVWLPAIAPPGASSGQMWKAQENTDHVQGRILIAEDEMQVRRWASVVLKNAGYKVVEAEDGEQAIREIAAAGGNFDLVILDCIMPRKGGMEAFAELHKLHPELPVLFISGHGYEPPDPNIYSGARFDFARKPFSATELLAAVQALATKREGVA